MSDSPEWFAPKRYGYGAGLPISWQGWVVTIGYVAIVYALIWRLHYRPAALIAAIALPTVAFIVITAKTTRGGWRWRWGGEDK
jgi:hypothetical protein